MWLNQLFIENPIDFEKRCRNRIVYGICFILLGAAAIGLSFAVRNHAMVMYLEQGYKDFMPGFYSGTGFGLAAAGVISIMRLSLIHILTWCCSSILNLGSSAGGSLRMRRFITMPAS